MRVRVRVSGRVRDRVRVRVRVRTASCAPMMRLATEEASICMRKKHETIAARFAPNACLVRVWVRVRLRVRVRVRV